MQAIAFLAVWFLLGGVVCYIAFRGGPGVPRQGARPLWRVLLPLVYLAGIAIPIVVITQTGPTVGGSGHLTAVSPNAQIDHGKLLFRQNCAGCHTLAAVNAHGITGPNLDQIGSVTPDRVLSAIRIGGIGDGRMPPGILSGNDARDVAAFVSAVAGQPQQP